MPTFCLIKSDVDKIKKALRSGEINPFKMADMSSEARRDFLAKFVGAENARQVNALFESKLLLKNQKAGYIAWAKKLVGIAPETKRDMISKIERLSEVLSPAENKKFLQDLAEKRLGLGISEAEAKTIFDLSNKTKESRATWEAKLKENPGMQPKEWLTDSDRIKYGFSLVNLENYINDLKLRAQKISFREQPGKATLKFVGELPGHMKSLMASLDNSLWGRQGIKTLLDVRTSPIWFRNFMKSWGDIGRQIKGVDALDLIKADIYSRPNAMNGKYKAGGYGLDALTEEAYPSSLPEKIPLFGRLFKASEAAYNGGALRLRADLADRLIGIAEKQGINTLDKTQAEAMGSLISSLTGRGNLGRSWSAASKDINQVLFSVKFLKSNFDTLTAHLLDEKATAFTKKEAAKNLLSMIASVAFVLTLAKLIDPDSVDEDPRSANFGKIKVFNRWRDITGGMAGLVTLATRTLVPTYHDGKWSRWSKSSTGKFTDLNGGKFGDADGWDILLDGLFSNKLSPAAGVFRDALRGKFFDGTKFTIPGAIERSTVPLSIQSFQNFQKDPTTSFIAGDMILEGLGFGASSIVPPNIKSQLIPEGKRVSNEDLIKTVKTYAEAVGTDPETAFNRMFTGQKIRRVDNGTIIVERMSLEDSTEVKKKAGANNPAMKLDHTIPLQLGGSNDESNLRLVTTSEWAGYTKIENALGKALKSKKIGKDQAQQLIKDFKAKKLTAQQVLDKIK